jgi:hypothetical protein
VRPWKRLLDWLDRRRQTAGPKPWKSWHRYAPTGIFIVFAVLAALLVIAAFLAGII